MPHPLSTEPSAERVQAQARQLWREAPLFMTSIANARSQWAPFLSTWAKDIASNASTPPNSKNIGHMIGWVDDAPFWSSFWKTWSRSPVAQTMNEEAQTEHLCLYIEGAAAAGSVSFFATMPPEMATVVHNVLVTTRVLIDPTTARWLQAQPPGDYDGVLLMQKAAWSGLRWTKTAHSDMTRCRGWVTASAWVDLACGAIGAGMVERECLERVVGHAMVNGPEGTCSFSLKRWQEARPGGLPIGLDLPLMALCSGHPVEGMPAAPGLAQRAHAMHEHGSFLDATEQDGADAGLIGMISSFGPTGTAHELYTTLSSMGWGAGATPALDIDGQVFGGLDARGP